MCVRRTEHLSDRYFHLDQVSDPAHFGDRPVVLPVTWLP